jgi:ArsR family transcriptional regulator
MNEQNDLTYMANLYMALADKTRLRLLNLMRDQEVCVGYFTEVLGDSQPKISRHLAYLRNVGIVEARREGKWMHYRIKWPEDRAVAGVIDATLRSLAGQSDCRSDIKMYNESYGNGPQTFNRSRQQSNAYVQAHMNEDEDDFEASHSSHNELEEFLL